MNHLNPFQAFASAMPSFTQPILPGWTLNIDSNNSSSPRTEGLVVSRFSYGRQLGQVNDALAAIVALLPAEARALPEVERFMRMAIQAPSSVGCRSSDAASWSAYPGWHSRAVASGPGVPKSACGWRSRSARNSGTMRSQSGSDPKPASNSLSRCTLSAPSPVG